MSASKKKLKSAIKATKAKVAKQEKKVQKLKKKLKKPDCSLPKKARQCRAVLIKYL